MMCLRNRRDPEFQGNRTLRTARMVNKAGDRNVASVNLPEKSARFIKDIVHTLVNDLTKLLIKFYYLVEIPLNSFFCTQVEAQWRWVISVFILSYFGSWLLFAALFYVISLSHGDLEFDEETGQRLGEGSEECIRGARDFTGFFLLSVESQVSTGYGEKYPTEECPEAIFLLIVQLVIGVVIDAAMVGIVYVKIIRPPKYANFKFGKNAVICQRDGKLCMIFRVADFKQSQSIDSKLRAYLFEEKITSEGERTGKIQQRMKLENNGRVFLIWPQTVCHYIDKDSPFYDMSARDLLQRKFEVVVSLTGISQHTGMTTQSRTSYLSNDILWGHRFVNTIKYDSQHEVYVTYADLLDDVEQVDTALCSAKRLDEIIDEVHEALETGTITNYLTNDDDDDEDDDEDYSKFDQHSEILTMKNIFKR
jgi:potassium inwardly-rectifying channel subfamily J, other